jgi:ParB-like chromosome segregation protein Spo0J
VSPLPKKAALPQEDFIPFHPLADIFPLMEGTEFDELVADIKANGLREWSITLFEGMILDGRNRYRALLKISPADGNLPQGAGPEFDVFDGDEAAARAFVISKNIHRRHLKPEDKIRFLAQLVAAQPEKSDRTLAKEAGVSHPTIAKARKKAEATGKALPVGKRTGADGKRRRQPTKRKPATKPDANALVWKREGRDTGAKTSGGFYETSKLDADLYATHFWPSEGSAVSLGTTTSLKLAKGLAQAHYATKQKTGGTEPSGSFERWQAEALAAAARATESVTTGATAATAAKPERSEILAADARYAGELVEHSRGTADWLFVLLRDDERRAAFVDALASALIPADGNDSDPAESAETRKAHFKAEEGDEDEGEDEKPRRRGKVKEVEVTLEHAVADAFADLMGLGEECREVVDNAPEGLNQRSAFRPWMRRLASWRTCKSPRYRPSLLSFL